MTQSSKIPYIKPHCTYDQQLNALVKQGMVFDVAESQAWQSDNIASKKLYNTLIMMVWMLNTIEPEHTWTHRLTLLLNKYVSIDPKNMGFIEGWQQQDIWR